MIFVSNQEKRKRFDRTSHKKAPEWPKLQRKHRAQLFFLIAAMILGASAFQVIFKDSHLLDAHAPVVYEVLLNVLAGAGIPFVFFAPVVICSYKSDVQAFTSEAAWRCRDTLEFQPTQMVYRYLCRRGGTTYEHKVPYDLIERIICDKTREVVVLLAGGNDTEIRTDGSVARRVNFYVGSGYVNQHPRIVTIPLVYTENEELLKNLQVHAPVEIEYGDSESAHLFD